MARLTRDGWVAEANRTPEEADEAERKLSRSGTPTTPRAARAARGRPTIEVSLPAESLARLDEIAADRQTSRSGAIVQLIRNARVRGMDAK